MSDAIRCDGLATSRTQPAGLARRHQEHYRSCGCLDEDGECCVPTCTCHPNVNELAEKGERP